jgi:acyl-lipid omega-6 desaturase (Delta-12 desaturase)
MGAKAASKAQVAASGRIRQLAKTHRHHLNPNGTPDTYQETPQSITSWRLIYRALPETSAGQTKAILSAFSQTNYGLLTNQAQHGASPIHISAKQGRELVLATRAYAVDHPWRSWWCILSTMLLLVAAIAGTHWNFSTIGKIACSVLAGLLTLRLFVIYHDQQHQAILPKSGLAEALMRVFGILALSPSSIWTSSHNHHHNHNSKLRGSNIGSFPIMTKDQFLRSSRAVRVQYLFMRHPLTILFGYIFVFLAGMCVFPLLRKPRQHYDCLVALMVHVAIGIALTSLFGWQALLLTELVPAFIAGAIGSYLFYAQHNFPEVMFNDAAGWTYHKAAMESSSFMRTGRIMGWFTANIGYHHIHHLNARIPFYRLPEVLRSIPELQTPKTTSLNPIEIVRCLRLKVWDVESQRMITLGEI